MGHALKFQGRHFCRKKKPLRVWLRQQKTEIPAMNGSAIKDDKLILWGMKATPYISRLTILNHDKTLKYDGKITGIIPRRVYPFSTWHP